MVEWRWWPTVYVSKYTSFSSDLSGKRYLEWVHDNGIRSDKAGDSSVCLVRFFATGRNKRTSLDVKGGASLTFIINEIVCHEWKRKSHFFKNTCTYYIKTCPADYKCRYILNILNDWDTHLLRHLFVMHFLYLAFLLPQIAYYLYATVPKH